MCALYARDVKMHKVSWEIKENNKYDRNTSKENIT